MDKYESKVFKYYQDNLEDEFDNSSVEHALVIVKYLFKYSKKNNKDIKIVTGTLDKNFYNTFVKEAKEVIDGDNTITIIAEKKPDDSDFKNLILKSDSCKLIEAETKFFKLPHFILVGDRAYRRESDNLLKTAKACFNGESMGDFLDSLFTDLEAQVS